MVYINNCTHKTLIIKPAFSLCITSNQHISGSTEDILVTFALSETWLQALNYDERISFPAKYASFW